MKGKIKGYATAEYTVSGKAGQTLSVKLKTNQPSDCFNIRQPGQDEALFIGSSGGNNYQSETAGRWRLHGAGVFDAQCGAQECGGGIHARYRLARLNKGAANTVDAARVTAPLGIVDVNITDVRIGK